MFKCMRLSKCVQYPFLLVGRNRIEKTTMSSNLSQVLFKLIFKTVIFVGTYNDSCFQFYSKRHTLLPRLNYIHRKNTNEKVCKGLVSNILRPTWIGRTQCRCYHAGVKCAWMASPGVINNHLGRGCWPLILNRSPVADRISQKPCPYSGMNIDSGNYYDLLATNYLINKLTGRYVINSKWDLYVWYSGTMNQDERNREFVSKRLNFFVITHPFRSHIIVPNIAFHNLQKYHCFFLRLPPPSSTLKQVKGLVQEEFWT